MSNHSASYLLNTFLTRLDAIEPFAEKDAAYVDKLCKLTWELCCTYDCNWGEIIDKALADKLGVCACCGERTHDLDRDGYCSQCTESPVGT
jgi:hypothetical protein